MTSVMTTKEALEYAKNMHFCTGCDEPQFSEDAEEVCDKCEHRQFFDLVIEALQEKQRAEAESQYIELCNVCEECERWKKGYSCEHCDIDEMKRDLLKELM